jgi:hypothetical protein
MKNKHFPLSTNENNKLIKIVRVLFGIVCIAISIFWLIFNIKSMNSDATRWVTILFLSGFGFYQIGTGMGYTIRFIEIGTDKIRLKKNAILPPVEILAEDIERIESLPLNIIFFLKTQKRILLRFGTTYHETNEEIIDEIFSFANSRQIPFEIINEKL